LPVLAQGSIRSTSARSRLARRFVVGNLSQKISRESDGMIDGGCVVQSLNVREPLANERIARSQLFEKRVSMPDQKFPGRQQRSRVTFDHET
jgi:hypothetical protein